MSFSQQDHDMTPTPQSPNLILNSLQFPTHSHQTTLCIGVLAHLDLLSREIAQMRNFIHTGYNRLNDASPDGGELLMKVESARLEARMHNKFHITELVEPFRTLPMSSGEYPEGVPCLGEHLKLITHKDIDWLLDIYELPFVPSMFLGEKKIVYLNFLGANRVVMHRILD